MGQKTLRFSSMIEVIYINSGGPRKTPNSERAGRIRPSDCRQVRNLCAEYIHRDVTQSSH